MLPWCWSSLPKLSIGYGIQQVLHGCDTRPELSQDVKTPTRASDDSRSDSRESFTTAVARENRAIEGLKLLSSTMLRAVVFRTFPWILVLDSTLPSPALCQTDRRTDRGQPFSALHGERITKPAVLSFPTLISVVGNKIVVFDYGADTMGAAFDIPSGRLLLRFGASGSDSGEFLAPVAIDLDRRSPDAFWVIDGRTHRATKLSFTSPRNGEIHLRVDSILALPVDSAVPIVASFLDSSGAIVLAGFFDGPRFARIRPGGSVADSLGPWPPGEDDIPLPIRQHAFQTMLGPDPKGGKFVAATRYSERIEVFALDGTRLFSAPRLRLFDPVYDVERSIEKGGFRAGLDLRQAYLSLATDKDGFYALFSGRNHLEAPGRAGFGVVVERYDWNANRQQVYGLDDDAVAIATDESGHTIYSLVHGRLPGIIRYRLAPGRRSRFGKPE